MAPSPWTWVLQPARSFVRLHAAQRPLPLRRSVSPPLATASAWSACRIGAPQNGVRQVWSRAVRNIRAACGKSRRRASVVIRSPVLGSVYMRRTQTWVFSSAVTRSRATGAGIGPWPTSWAGSLSLSARVRSVITRCSSIAGWAGSPGFGVSTRETRSPELARESVQRCVGHHLAAGVVLVRVTGGAHRPPVQFPVDGDALLHRQQRGQIGHAIGRGADGHPPVGGGLAGPVHGTVGVETVHPGAGFPFGAGVTPLAEVVPDGGVDLRPLLLVQVGGFPGDHGGPPLAGLAAFQGTQHPGHLVQQ